MFNDSLYRISLKCFITNAEGDVLVVRERGRGSWDLPGGGIDHGEDIYSALARELNEELDYSSDFSYEIIGIDDPAKLLTRDVWQCKLIFKVTLDLSLIAVGKDAEEVIFINPDTLKDSVHPPEQSVYRYAKKYL